MLIATITSPVATITKDPVPPVKPTPPTKPDPALAALRTAMAGIDVALYGGTKAVAHLASLTFDATKPPQASFDAVIGATRGLATAIEAALAQARTAARAIVDPKLRLDLLKHRQWGQVRVVDLRTLAALKHVPVTKEAFPNAQKVAVDGLRQALQLTQQYKLAVHDTLIKAGTPKPPA